MVNTVEYSLILNLSIDMACVLLSMVALMGVLMWVRVLGKSGIYAGALLILNILQITSNALGLFFKGSTLDYAHSILVFSNFFEFFFEYALTLCMGLYILSCMSDESRTTGWKITAFVIFGISEVLLIISQFNGMYYTISSTNYYERSEGYFLSLIMGILSILLNLLMTIRFRDRLEKSQRMAIYAYLILPGIAAALQAYLYGIFFMMLLDTLVLNILFINMLNIQARKYKEHERELANARMDVMLTQIQPHFMYNALAVIDRLCVKDPEMARKALANFSNYLRFNINTLKKRELISFDDELRHIKAYLSLEEMRYGDLLNVEYSVSCVKFLLPPLSVQPLVENSVKHGLSDKEGGGTVRISAEETEEGFLVCVEDDGIGFEPGEFKGTGTHIGLKNISVRLSEMCGGSLKVESVPGKGTKSYVYIPKQGTPEREYL